MNQQVTALIAKKTNGGTCRDAERLEELLGKDGEPAQPAVPMKR